MLSTKDIRALYGGIFMNRELDERKMYKLKVSQKEALIIYYIFQHGLQLINPETPDTIIDIAPDDMIQAVKKTMEDFLEGAELKQAQDVILKILKK
jgi:hypothetical protein